MPHTYHLVYACPQRRHLSEEGPLFSGFCPCSFFEFSSLAIAQSSDSESDVLKLDGNDDNAAYKEQYIHSDTLTVH